MEHFNRVLKDSIHQLTPECITRSGKAIGTLAPVVQHFDTMQNIIQPSGTYCTTKFEKYLKMIANELLTNTQSVLKGSWQILSHI